MTNIKIFQAKKKDENQIIDFLINNHEWKASKLIWKNIFNNNWCDLDNFGYMLKDKNKIVGYFGIIFSKNKNHNFRYTANIHSWIVKPEYRGYSLLLLKKAMGLEDTLFISHSTINRILKIYYRYDWKILDDEQYYLLGYYYSNSNFKTKLINNENYTDLSENNKKIYLDHKDYYSIFFKILIGGKKILVIVKKKKN